VHQRSMQRAMTLLLHILEANCFHTALLTEYLNWGYSWSSSVPT
jgi:hypothetical protein